MFRRIARTGGKPALVVAVLLAAAIIAAGVTGCGGKKPADQGRVEGPKVEAPKDVAVGWILHLTGRFASQGEGVKKGVELAIERINAEGGVKSLGGAKIKVVWGDAQSKPDTAMSEAERLATQENVPLIVGSVGSGDTMPVSQVVERLKVPFLNALASEPALYKQGFKYVWGIAAVSQDYAYGQVDFLDYLIKKGLLKVERVAAVYQDSPYGKAVAEATKERLKEKGMENLLVDEEFYSTKASDLTPVVAKIKAAKPDIVLQTSYMADGIQLYKAYDQLDFHPIVIGTGGGAGDPRIPQQIGDLAEGLFAADQWSVDRAQVGALNDEFKKRYGGLDMDVNAGLGYQAALVVKAALEKAGSVEPERIAAAFRSLDVGPGPGLVMPFERIKFDDTGRNLGTRSLVTEFQGLKKVTVWPESMATAKPVIKAR